MYLTQSRGKHFYTICPSYYKVRSNLLQFSFCYDTAYSDVSRHYPSR